MSFRPSIRIGKKGSPNFLFPSRCHSFLRLEGGNVRAIYSIHQDGFGISLSSPLPSKIPAFPLHGTRPRVFGNINAKKQILNQLETIRFSA